MPHSSRFSRRFPLSSPSELLLFTLLIMLLQCCSSSPHCMRQPEGLIQQLLSGKAFSCVPYLLPHRFFHPVSYCCCTWLCRKQTHFFRAIPTPKPAHVTTKTLQIATAMGRPCLGVSSNVIAILGGRGYEVEIDREE